MMTKTDEAEKKLEQRRRDRLRQTLQLSPIQRQTDAWVDWIETSGEKLDMVFSLHVPHRMRIAQQGYDADWLQRHVAVFLNCVEKHALKDTPVRQRKRIPRFIVLHRTDSVGWHAHGLIQTPSHLSHVEFSALMSEAWKSRVHKYEAAKFLPRLFWCEAREGSYADYSIQKAIEFGNFNADGRDGIFDERNTSL